MEVPQKPLLRGVMHQYAFVAAIAAGAMLVALAEGARARTGAWVYAASLALMFGLSALYHRVTWQPAARRLMRRLDHSAIFLLIAGTYTPYALLVLSGACDLIAMKDTIPGTYARRAFNSVLGTRTR